MIEAGVLMVLAAAALGAAAARLARRFRPLLAAQPSGRSDRLNERLTGALAEFVSHRRLLNARFAGVYHAANVASFLILIATKIRAFAEILAPGSDALRALLPLHDVAVVAMLAAVAAAVVNRLWLSRARFAGSNHRDAAVILAAISFIVLASEADAVAHVIAKPSDAGQYALAAPLARWLGAGASFASAVKAEHVFRWAHIAAVLAFIVYVPGSKHLHAVTGLPNLFFRNLAPRGQLRPRTEIAPPANALSAQTWKSLFDLYSCSECGRCQAACPAHNSGKPLNPKTLIMGLRSHLVETAYGRAPAGMALAGEVVAEDALWSCTSCYACTAVCPLRIEHIPKIVELRRALVDDGRLDPGLTAALNAARRYGNVFKRPAKQRPKWADGLDFDIPDGAQVEVDYLWFVGDHASFHPAAAERTRRFARLLKSAGVSFGILHADERSSGNDIRRIGEEDLFQELARHNIEAISACRFVKIVTTDPHSFNTLVNEYPAFGLKADVVHHTELIADLIASGRLEAPKTARRRVTYHDPCYLGRYNGRFEAARAIITRLGHDLVEMPRNREASFCCGAGGGRIFMTDPPSGARPADLRLAEAAQLEGVEWFVVACPKDYVMFSDASKARDEGPHIAVKEIVDLFFDGGDNG